MYSDAGSKTCLGLPGSRGNEELDAQYFADLGVDFLKYDNCNAPASDWIVDRYSAMRDALNKTGRPILFSMCNWGAGDPWNWAQKVPSRNSFDDVLLGNDFRPFEPCVDIQQSILKHTAHLDASPKHASEGNVLEVSSRQAKEDPKGSLTLPHAVLDKICSHRA